ncbi:hypothetical protein AAH991_06390 [Microbispora sp. ZYX-F-249]|uniref:Uncharacterized protein n=1 Tax=Microbispora maris TaxID=3144104 RepID=A0ABV0AKM5_9ACTN
MNLILPVLPELIHLRHHELLRQAEQHRRNRAVPARLITTSQEPSK